jgi:vacuolar-type H+-ATPase subunit F/Vma7
MSVLVIGSREVVTAFAFGGLRGEVVAGRREALQALAEAAGAAGVRILIVEEEIAELVRAEVDRLKLDPTAPLVVEVPGLGGAAERRKGARQLVREALGIKI